MLEVSNGNRTPARSVEPDEMPDPLPAPAIEVSEQLEPEPQSEPEYVTEAAEISPGAAVKALLSAPFRWLRRRGRLLVVALVMAGLAAGLITTDLRLRHQDAVASARNSALAAAKTYATELASYDYHHLDQDFGTVRQHSSPAFQASFSQSSSALATVLARYQATATASVVSAGIVSASTSRAVALVFLEQVVKNSTQKSGPQKEQSKVQMTLVYRQGHWLIDQVQLL